MMESKASQAIHAGPREDEERRCSKSADNTVLAARRCQELPTAEQQMTSNVHDGVQGLSGDPRWSTRRRGTPLFQERRQYRSCRPAMPGTANCRAADDLQRA